MPTKQDPLGDSLARSLAHIVYSRPDPSPYTKLSAPRADGTAGPASGTTDRAPRAERGAAAASSERPASGIGGEVLAVSHVTKEFNDRHVWVDGRGNEVRMPETRVVETQKYATMVHRPPKSHAERAAEREAFSLNLWKKVNPGYMPTTTDISQYQDEHSFVPEDMQMTKGEPKQWRHHLLKTDTNKYVEAVARAKVFAGVAASQGKK